MVISVLVFLFIVNVFGSYCLAYIQDQSTTLYRTKKASIKNVIHITLKCDINHTFDERPF